MSLSKRSKEKAQHVLVKIDTLASELTQICDNGGYEVGPAQRRELMRVKKRLMKSIRRAVKTYMNYGPLDEDLDPEMVLEKLTTEKPMGSFRV